MTPSILAIATKRLNLRVRSNGKSAVEMLTSKDLMTDETFTNLNRQIKEEITSRRKEQQKHDTSTKAKTREKIPFEQYSPGVIVMLRESSNLDKRREMYVVLKDGGDLVEIRKMEKQLRLKTYRVKREQLLKVFNTPQSNLKDENANTKSSTENVLDKKTDEEKTKSEEENSDVQKKESDSDEEIFCRPKRQAALR